jgi:hypothetical protein
LGIDNNKTKVQHGKGWSTLMGPLNQFPKMKKFATAKKYQLRK